MSGRMMTLSINTKLVTEECCDCGVLFAMPDDLYEQLQRSKRSFYCPNGHSQSYRGETFEATLARVEREKASLREDLRIVEIERRNAETAHKRAETRRKNLQKRVEAGVCPHCHRTFQQLARHMKSKHVKANG